jgi:hypothetical protein
LTSCSCLFLHKTITSDIQRYKRQRDNNMKPINKRKEKSRNLVSVISWGHHKCCAFTFDPNSSTSAQQSKKVTSLTNIKYIQDSRHTTRS